jgi:hypothetical protein
MTARFSDLLASEWIKIRSLRSTPWTLALVTVFVIACSATATVSDPQHAFLLGDAFSTAGGMTLMLAAGSIGAITTVSEYSSGLIRTTTVAVPARASLVLAKAVVVTALWTVLGAIMAGGSFAVSDTVLSRWHAAVPVTHPGVFRAFLASALLAPVCALIGLGLGVLIRHSATTMVTSTFALLMLPVLFTPSRRWTTDVNHAMVLSAWRRLVEAWGPPNAVGPGHYPTLTGALVVYAAWPLAAVALAVIAVRRRDV